MKLPPLKKPFIEPVLSGILCLCLFSLSAIEFYSGEGIIRYKSGAYSTAEDRRSASAYLAVGALIFGVLWLWGIAAQKQEKSLSEQSLSPPQYQRRKRRRQRRGK